MNTTIPLHYSTIPTVFGFNYQPPALQHIQEALAVNIIPRLDFAKVEKHCKRWAILYTYNLMHEYPDFINTKSGRWNHHKKFNELNVGKSELATLKLLLTFFAGYLAKQREGKAFQPFQINGAMLRAKGLGSVKTYTNHLWVLEQAGFFKTLVKENPNEWYETIQWNARFIKWLRDGIYQKQVLTNMLLKDPKLAQTPNFDDWQKRLKQPVFWAVDPMSQKNFRTLQYNQILSNSSLTAELFINGGNSVSRQTPFRPEQEDKTLQAAAQDLPLGRPAANFEKMSLTCKNKNEELIAKVQEEKEKKAWMDKAFSLMIGILWKWFGEDYSEGRIPAEQVDATKEWIAYWLFDKKRDTRQHLYGYIIPVLNNLRRSNDKKNTWEDWKPKMYLYFDPHWQTDDGRPIGFRKAMSFYDENLIRIEQRKKEKQLRKGTLKKIRSLKEREDILLKCFDFVWKHPSEKNYIKARNRILKYDDPEVLQNFYHAVRSAKLLPHKFMERQKIKITSVL